MTKQVELIGGPFDGQLLTVSDVEPAILLKGAVDVWHQYRCQEKKLFTFGQPHRAEYQGWIGPTLK